MGKDPSSLVSQFITWLAKCPELLEQQKRVLEFMNQQSLLLLLINLISANKSVLNGNQRRGLANYLVQELKLDGKELAQLVSWGDWDWLEALEITDSTRRGFILVHEALRNPAYVAHVLGDEAARERFIFSLAHKHLSTNEIKRLMNAISRSDLERPGSPQGYSELAALDQTWKVSPDQKQALISLLSLLILGNEAYLKSLEGNFDVKALAPSQPLRLSKLLSFLDLKQLSPGLICKLKPEVLVNLLCSARHFSGWQQEQLQAVFDGLKSVDNVLKYWLDQCLDLPNAGLMLAAIFNVNSEAVQGLMASLGEYQRTRVLQTMLPCLELYDSRVASVFAGFAHEEVLKQALRLYGHGHQSAGLIAAIGAMVDKINSQSLFLHPELGQLLLPLYQNPAFESCQVKLNAGLLEYLRFNARTASLEPFHKIDGIDPGLLNVEISPCAMVAESGMQVIADYPGEGTSELAIPESPLAAQLQSMTAFEYYLLHYNGDTNQIASLTRSWILSQAASLNEENRTRLTRVAAYMQAQPPERRGISDNAREALFINFLQTPGLFNPEFCYSLMAYDAKKSIGHYSQTKNYPVIIALCDHALDALSGQKQPPEWRAMAEKARLEARTEQSIASIRGWFSGLRRWWARARAYGFFSSKTPQFVLAYNEPAASPCLTQVQNFVKPSPVGDLLLQAVNAKAADKIHFALKHYLHQPQSQYDWDLLEKVEQAYTGWQTDPEMDSWLLNHKDAFIDNRQALLAHYLCLADHSRAKSSLVAWSDTALFTRSKEALYPEKEWPRVVSRSLVQQEQVQPNVFGRLLGAVGMGATPPSQQAPVSGEPGNRGWLGNLVSGLFNPNGAVI